MVDFVVEVSSCQYSPGKNLKVGHHTFTAFFTLKLAIKGYMRNDSGANFQRNDSDSGPKVRDTGRKSELQTKSRRYSPESEPNRPEKGPERGLGASAENPPLKPS